MNSTYPPRRAFMLYLRSTHAAVDKSSAVMRANWAAPEMLHLNPEPANHLCPMHIWCASQAENASNVAPVLEIVSNCAFSEYSFLPATV